MMTDPISDLLTRIRNASAALLPELVVSHSNIKASIARILKEEGYIADYSTEEKPVMKLKLKLKYQGRQGVIRHLRRVSSPGLRRYVRSAEIPRVLGGMGTVIISTSRGLMTGRQARKDNLGGELICYVW